MIKTIETNLLDYDETYIAPFVCYHLMTTINNLTMLNPDRQGLTVTANRPLKMPRPSWMARVAAVLRGLAIAAR